MEDRKDAPHKDYSVDEILAEARIKKDGNSAPAPKETERKPLPREEEIAKNAREALKVEAGKEEDRAAREDEPRPSPAPAAKKAEEPAPKKKRFSLFGRRKKSEPEFNEEEDLYYGLQLKPLEEYRKEYEKSLRIDHEREEEQSKASEQSSFPYLFEKGGEPDPEMAETFERVHRERQKRLEKIMQKAGLDPDEMLSDEAGPGNPGREMPQPHPDTVPMPQKPEQPPAVAPGPPPAPVEMPQVSEPVIQPPGSPEILTSEKVEVKERPQPGTKQPDSPPFPPVARPKKVEEGDKAKDSGEDAAKTVDKIEREPENPPVKDPVSQPTRQRPPAEPPRTEPLEGPRPEYRVSSDRPLHIILAEPFDELLVSEAEVYSVLPLPVPPVPIPFPPREMPGPEEDVGVEEEPAEESGEEDEPPNGYPLDSENAGSAQNEVEEAEPEGEPAEPIPIPIPEPPAAGEVKKRFRLFGTEEIDDDTGEIPAEHPEELDDYESPADAPSVAHDLVGNVSRLSLRLAVTGIASLLLLAFGIAFEHPAILPPGIHSLLGGQSFLIINAVFLVIAALFCIPTISNGLRGLFVFQSDSDTAASVAVFASLVQTVLLLILGFPSEMHLYTPLAAAALFLNTAGKLSMERRILRSFRYISAPIPKHAVRIYDDYNTSIRLAKDFVIGEPRIAYQTETGFFSHFLKISYTPDPGDQISQVMAPLGFVLSLILCGVCSYLTRSAVAAVTVFAAASCVCVPFTNMLCVNLPLAGIARIARRGGSMVGGWPAVDQFSNTNAVMLDAQDLFPHGTVILNGIRTFAGQRIDDAILDAAALMGTVGGPLADLFDQIIKNRRDILPKITDPVYHDEKGVTGVVSGRKILVGNRDLLKEEGIEPPSRDYEQKYVRGGKQIIYLASDGELMAMFLVSYASDRRRALELRRAEHNGIGLIVRTSDPNITPDFLSECFGIDRNSVRVLPEELGKVYTDLEENPPERVAALLATKGHTAAMLRLLSACVRQRSNIMVAVALQCAGVTLGFLLVAFLSLYAGFGQLSLTSLSLYEAFWAAAVIFVPRIRKP